MGKSCVSFGSFFSTNMLLTPKFGKESDLWVRLDEESVWWKDLFRDIRQRDLRSAICSRSAKEHVELILRGWTVTWLNQEERMDG
jgi:hypothetical protein